MGLQKVYGTIKTLKSGLRRGCNCQHYRQNVQKWNSHFVTSAYGNTLKVKKKKKGNVIPVLNLAPRHEGVLGEWRYNSTHTLTSALDGGE
jgi:hypothetical protein